MAWKIGELAKQTGISIRTLHYYHEIGLLVPSDQTEAGHRIYIAGDVARLQQIVSLRSLGLSLDEIKAALDDDGLSPREILKRQIDRVREEIADKEQLLKQLEYLAGCFDLGAVATANDFFHLLRTMTMIEKYYTPEQLESLRQRRETLGEEAIRAVEVEWPRLMASVEAEFDAGTDPKDARVQALAVRWRALVEAFTGGDPGIEQSLRRMYEDQAQTQVQACNPRMTQLMEYIEQALA